MVDIESVYLALWRVNSIQLSQKIGFMQCRIFVGGVCIRYDFGLYVNKLTEHPKVVS